MPRFPFCFHIRIVAELIVFTIVLTFSLLLLFWCLDSVRETREEKYFQYVPQCSCWRPFFYPPLNRKRLQSSCSDEAALYEPFQKVVSFSYYETYNQSSASVYKDGILRNLKLVQTYYPKYTMRLYTNFSLTPESPVQEEFCDLLCANRQLHWCDISNTPSHGNLSVMYPSTWRYLPLGDPSVELFLSRDLDGVISEREATTVQDWIDMNNGGVSSANRKGFQVMRDHKLHSQPIMNGLWSADNLILGRRVTKDLQNRLIWFNEAYRPRKLNKRKSLATKPADTFMQFIYKIRTRDFVAYDSYYCTTLGNSTMTKPFPVRRHSNMDYVGRKEGSIFENIDRCPMECRPENGKTWEFC